jgi:hypothetical protein
MCIFVFRNVYSCNLIKTQKQTSNFGITETGSNELHFG